MCFRTKGFLRDCRPVGRVDRCCCLALPGLAQVSLFLSVPLLWLPVQHIAMHWLGLRRHLVVGGPGVDILYRCPSCLRKISGVFCSRHPWYIPAPGTIYCCRHLVYSSAVW